MTYGVPTQTNALPPGCDDPPDLSFLAPTARPDSLGRIAHYEILGILGCGGMGVVLKGFDPKLDRVVAIKLVSPRLANSDRARRRFLREARSAAAISHVNVVTIHAVNEEHGLPYLVMECLVGRSVKERIDAGPKLRPREVMRIGLQIAEGLEAAHLHGVIHRDIKPANIMLLDHGGGVKITDFGLARVELDVAEMTSADQVVGTPAYMSPEQVRGEALDARSDLFSLGCVLFAMVAGRSPFQGRHILEIGRRITDEDPTPLHLVDPAVPRPLSDLVGRLLRKAPDDRPATAGEVADELRHLLEDTDLDLGPTLDVRPAIKSVTGKGRRSRAARWVAAGAVLLLAALAVAWFARLERAMTGRSGDAESVRRRPTTGPGRPRRPRPGGRLPNPAAGAGVRLPPRHDDPADRAGGLPRGRPDRGARPAPGADDRRGAGRRPDRAGAAERGRQGRGHRRRDPARPDDRLGRRAVRPRGQRGGGGPRAGERRLPQGR